MTPNVAAVILAGGQARRFGTDKLMVRVGGRPLLQRTVDAVSFADPVVAVGPRRPRIRGVRWTREHPAGGGPLAGLAAGLREVPGRAELVAVLAGDHPWLTRQTLTRLIDAVGEAPGAVLVDDGGQEQWLVGVWRTDVLRQVTATGIENRSVRSELGVLCPKHVPASGSEGGDIDTPEDLRRFR